MALERGGRCTRTAVHEVGRCVKAGGACTVLRASMAWGGHGSPGRRCSSSGPWTDDAGGVDAGVLPRTGVSVGGCSSGSSRTPKPGVVTPGHGNGREAPGAPIALVPCGPGRAVAGEHEGSAARGVDAVPGSGDCGRSWVGTPVVLVPQAGPRPVRGCVHRGGNAHRLWGGPGAPMARQFRECVPRGAAQKWAGPLSPSVPAAAHIS